MERPFLHQALSHRKMESQSEHLQMRKSSCGAGLTKDSMLVEFADQLLYLKKETHYTHYNPFSVPQPLWWGRDFEQMFFIFIFYLIFLGLDFTIFITVTGPIHFKNPAGKLLQYWLLSWIFRAAWLLWIFSIFFPPPSPYAYPPNSQVTPKFTNLPVSKS